MVCRHYYSAEVSSSPSSASPPPPPSLHPHHLPPISSPHPHHHHNCHHRSGIGESKHGLPLGRLNIRVVSMKFTKSDLPAFGENPVVRLRAIIKGGCRTVFCHSKSLNISPLYLVFLFAFSCQFFPFCPYRHPCGWCQCGPSSGPSVLQQHRGTLGWDRVPQSVTRWALICFYSLLFFFAGSFVFFFFFSSSSPLHFLPRSVFKAPSHLYAPRMQISCSMCWTWASTGTVRLSV